jgi:Na+-driven multidrug efflux pump/anti-sigma regulatory factor (Ser/Thr protein kinase)
MENKNVLYARTNKLLNRKFREFLIPTLLNNTALSLSAVIDNVLVGNLLGETELAAMSIAFPFISGINMLALVFIIGGVILSSSAAGSKDMESANSFFTVSVFSGAGSIILYCALFGAFISPLSLLLSNGDADLAVLAATYIKPMLFGGFLIYLTNCLSQFTLSEGRVKMSVMFLIVANVCDLLFGYIFMGPMKLGVTGAGLSTICGYVIGFICTIPYLASKKRMFRFARPRKGFIKKIGNVFKAGLSPFLEQGATLIRTLVLNALILTSLGQNGMTAMAVIVSVQSVIQIVLDGTSNALTPIISSLSGERDFFGIKNVTKTALKVLTFSSLIISLYFIIFPETVAAAFGVNDESVISVVAAAVRLYAMSFIIYALNNAFQNIYNALGRNGISTYIAFMENSVFVIAFALLFMHINPNLIWLGFLGAETATFISVMICIILVSKKEKVKGFLLLSEDEQTESDETADVADTTGNNGGSEIAFWDTTIPANIESATDLSAKVINFCNENGIDSKTANSAGIAVEEMAVNIARYGSKKKLYFGKNAQNKSVIDILIKKYRGKLIIRIRDDGMIFDPLTFEPNDTESEVTAEKEEDKKSQPIYHGLEVVKKIASTIDYNRALGLNNTVITLNIAY